MVNLPCLLIIQLQAPSLLFSIPSLAFQVSRLACSTTVLQILPCWLSISQAMARFGASGSVAQQQIT